MRRNFHLFAMAGMTGLAFATAAPLAPNSAHIIQCNNQGYCIYEAQGTSGNGAHGTGANVTLPGVESLGHSDDVIAGAAFLYVYQTEAVETGLAYGYTLKCGTEDHWHPYATLNNGGSEQDDCGYQVGDYTKWQVQSYIHNNTAFSFFNSQYGTAIWAVNWGYYPVTGENLTQLEVHGDNDKPSFGSTMEFYDEQYYNGSSWLYWNSTNVSSACPYIGARQSNDDWYAYDAYNC